MFDPTAFENMRVVMDGIFYDKDLSGEIMIIDRNDMINTAKLSRAYDLTFHITTFEQEVRCKFYLTAGLENFTAELHPSHLSDALAGCMASIEFTFEHDYNESLFIEVEAILKEIWGEQRKIKVSVGWDSMMKPQKACYHALVSFDRIIHEDQLDDLTEMVDYMLFSLKKLESIV